MKIDSAAINDWMLRLDTVQSSHASISRDAAAPASAQWPASTHSAQLASASPASAAHILAAPMPDRPPGLVSTLPQLAQRPVELGPEFIDHWVESVLAELSPR
ncbi:MAG: hypothetical protein ACXIUM_12045 [Wenzhouxiangella sp.]